MFGNPPFRDARASCNKHSPSSPPSVTTPNDSLHLIPHDDSPPIHLVARGQFRIGRSPDHSDWIARFQPETPENEILTNELGRVHVVGEVAGGRPALRDGNGTEASINGSAFDGHPLSANGGTSVRHRGLLALGELYAVDLVPLFCEADDFLIEDHPEWRGQHSDVHGAIVFAPLVLAPTLRDAAWIFTRLDFTLRPNGGPAWLPPKRGNPAAFLRCDGGFWLANANLPGDAMRLDHRSVPVGEAVLLGVGQSLRLGAREYAIEAESE